MSENKVPVAFLTIRGYSVQLTRVTKKESGGFEFLNDDKLYTKKRDFDALVAGTAKSVPFYESSPLEVQSQDKTFKSAGNKK